jgi:hypothetical protein
MTSSDMWSYTGTVAIAPNTDLTGFTVEAIDGKIGKVDEATYDVGSSYIVVDTGPWIFGKKVMLPAGVIQNIDPDTETIFVQRTKDEIKNAPEFDEQKYRDQHYRDQLGDYYSGRGDTHSGGTL